MQQQQRQQIATSTADLRVGSRCLFQHCRNMQCVSHRNMCRNNLTCHFPETEIVSQTLSRPVILIHHETQARNQTLFCPVTIYSNTLRQVGNQMLFHPDIRLRLRLGFVHPLQDVALHQCLPLSSVCCFPNPGGSLLLCYVILPSSAWASS